MGWSSPTATCTGGVFPWSTSAFTYVRTNELAHITTCTVWWWWWWLLFYVYRSLALRSSTAQDGAFKQNLTIGRI